MKINPSSSHPFNCVLVCAKSLLASHASFFFARNVLNSNVAWIHTEMTFPQELCNNFS